jgi:hypothetical protein
VTSNDFGRYTRLSEQGPAFEALTALEVMLPSLPPAYFTIYANSYESVSVQCDTLPDFEAWRTALQVPTHVVELRAGASGGWLAVETTFRGVGLRITGNGVDVTAEQAAPPVRPDGHGMEVVTLAEAVAKHGPFPMPAGTPAAGELAEQRHLLDPLDHTLEHLADERPTVSPEAAALAAVDRSIAAQFPLITALNRGAKGAPRG